MTTIHDSAPNADSLPAAPGTYVLLIALAAPQRISVGRLGSLDFAAGVYLYVGSAHGSGGLRARVGRHLRRDKRAHWHIDALTAAAPVTRVWWAADDVRRECTWSAALADHPAVTEPAAGFGASDCACRTHLYQVAAGMEDAVWGVIAALD